MKDLYYLNNRQNNRVIGRLFFFKIGNRPITTNHNRPNPTDIYSTQTLPFQGMGIYIKNINIIYIFIKFYINTYVNLAKYQQLISHQ